MASYRFEILFAVVIFGTLQCAQGISDENKAKIKETVIPKFMECAAENKLDNDTIKGYKGVKELPDDTGACFFACVFKKIEIMDEKGLFSEEKALEKSEKFAENEEEKTKMIESAKTCSAVNAEDVSDGEKGCDRAKLMFACFKSEAEKLGLFVPMQ